MTDAIKRDTNKPVVPLFNKNKAVASFRICKILKVKCFSGTAAL